MGQPVDKPDSSEPKHHINWPLLALLTLGLLILLLFLLSRYSSATGSNPLKRALQAIGLQGPAGQNGKDGINGIIGQNGRDGVAGVDGSPGARGAAGVDGAAGSNGATGSEGPQGPAGGGGSCIAGLCVSRQVGTPGTQETGNINIDGAIIAASLAGNGSSLTSLNASNISSGTLAVARGGTGVDGSAAANGTLLIGNGTGYSLATLTQGTGINIANAAGSITISNTGAAAACSASSSYVCNGGNTLAASLTIGTNDANSLILETNNQSAVTIASGGAVTFQNNTDTTSGFRVMDADGGTPILNVDTTNERVGIGVSNPDFPLEIAAGSFGKGIKISEVGGSTQIYSAGTRTILAPRNSVLDIGDEGANNNIGYLNVYGASIGNYTPGDKSTSVGLRILTRDASDKGLVINGYTAQTADLTQWQDSGGVILTSIDSSGKLVFGPSGSQDTNLYRSAADTLRTDDAFTTGGIITAGAVGTADNSTYLCRNSSNQIATCNSSGAGVAFVQGGNTFGATATLGTNDANSLVFETNNQTAATIASGGAVTFQNNTDTTSGFVINDADGGTPIFNVDTTNERVGIGTATPNAKLEINNIGSNTNPLVINTNGSAGNYTPTNSGIFIKDAAGNEIMRIFASDPNGANQNSGNLYIGHQAGFSNPTDNVTAGYSNTGVGDLALYYNTTGDYNTALGQYALWSNTIGNENTATTYALVDNTTGSYNSAYGSEALVYNTVGSYNSALGTDALYNSGKTVTAGSFVVGMQYTIQSTGTTDFTLIGAANSNVGTVFTATGVGTGTGRAASSTHYNTAVGSDALRDSIVGSNNTALGYNTGRGITTGSNNTILGANVTGLSANLSNNIIIADGSGNQRINVDSSGNVGIGDTTPNATLHILPTGGASFTNGLRLDNGAAGHNWLVQAGSPAVNNDYFTIADLTAGDLVRFTIDSSGNVGIGDITPDYLLDVAGTFGVDGAVTLGDAAGDTVTVNSGAWTFANDTTVALSGGVNGLNFDSNTLSIDATNNRIGIGTAAPGEKLTIEGDSAGLLIQTTSDPTVYRAKIVVNWDYSHPVSFTGLNNTEIIGQYAYDVVVGNTSGNVGIGDTTPDYKLDVEATSTSTAAVGLQASASTLYVAPASASSTGFIGLAGSARVTSGLDYIDNNVTGLYGLAANQDASGTSNIFRGVAGQIANDAAGTIGTAYALQATNPAVSAGTITNNYGLFVSDQIAGTSDYGIAIEGADTQALWISSGANNTDAANGIAFGSSRDTNLYRSAADTLKTDDSFVAGNGLTVTTGGATISAGGVTVSAGGADITGTLVANNNVTFSGLIDTGADRNTVCASGAGVLTIDAAGNNCDTSSARFKHDITELNLSGLDLVNAMKPKSFVYDSDEDQGVRWGFIAEDMADIDPHFGVFNEEGQVYSIYKYAIMAALADAIQELDAKVGSLESAQLAQGIWNGGIVTQDTEFAANVTFDAITTFNGQSVFTGSSTFDGPVSVNGVLSVNNPSNSGSVTIPAGSTTTHITFASPHSSVPKVSATPKTLGQFNFAVQNVTASGFDIVIAPSQNTNVEFDWLAI